MEWNFHTFPGENGVWAAEQRARYADTAEVGPRRFRRA